MKYLSSILKNLSKITCIYYVQGLGLFAIRKTTFNHVKLRYSSVPGLPSILIPGKRIEQLIQVNHPKHPIFLWANK